MAYGLNVTVKYTLTNASDRPVASCAAAWDEFELVDAQGTRFGGGFIIATGYTENDAFRLPSHGALTWQVKMVLPQAAVGRAQFQGMFQSGDGNWVGTVRSEPVPLEVVEWSALLN